MKQALILLISFMAVQYCGSKYILGKQGESCNEACHVLGMNCNPTLAVKEGQDLFADLGVHCNFDPRPWWGEDQPSYVSAVGDPSYGRCLGYRGMPAAIQCTGSHTTTSRLCRCDEVSSSPSVFGTGYSSGTISTEEKWIFQHIVAPGDVGVLTHLWITYLPVAEKGVVIRYYIDGEKTASIQFIPSLACGVGYYDSAGPWGTEWFGKGAKDAGWYNNFKIPFQKSLVVTAQHLYGNHNGFYIILRGAINIPIVVGGMTLPKTARMKQHIIDGVFQPMEYVPLVNIPSGPGAHWMVTMSAGSQNLNFLEGCIHAYFDGNTEFPGVVLATGTEDYFDSAWYFNGGPYHFPEAGFTHMSLTDNYVTWSAYRFHNNDPLFFNNGFQLYWRIGDMLDAAETKCHIITGGNIFGTPTASQVLAYAWTYIWPAQ